MHFTFTINLENPFVWIFALWYFYKEFAGAISIYRFWLKKKLNLWNKVMFSPYLVSYFLTDVFINFTFLGIIYKTFSGEYLPPKGCVSMSDRFQVYHKSLLLDMQTPFEATAFQKDTATFVCEKLLNPVDPSGEHC